MNEIPAIFKLLDTGNDGTIDRSEFLTWWAKVANGDDDFGEEEGKTGPPPGDFADRVLGGQLDAAPKAPKQHVSTGGKKPKQHVSTGGKKKKKKASVAPAP